MQKPRSKGNSKQLQRVRLDKWLWAARFYKTRALAKRAVEGGKVRCEKDRAKPSKDIEIDMEISLRQGFDEKTVIVTALSDQRRGAPEAQLLYAETEASVAKRLALAVQRKTQPSVWPSASKPNKKQRRLIHKFKQGE
jgi:ribosome-associated heat shock protein Hsp15